jgi:amylosucrase
MLAQANLQKEARRTFARLLPRLETEFAADRATEAWATFRRRLDAHFNDLFELLFTLYGDRYDFLYHLERLLVEAAQSWLERPAALQALDAERERAPLWYQSEQMLGGVYYVDLFAGDLKGMRAKIPYFQELGLTYLHLMPLFKAPEGDSDGGYAVSDYREVDAAPRRDGRSARAGDGVAPARHQPGAGLCLQPHVGRAPLGVGGAGWRRRLCRLLLCLPRPHAARRLRPHAARDLPRPASGQLHLSPDMQRWVWTTFNSFSGI